MKKYSFLIFLVALITSCSAPKNVAYLWNSNDVDLSQSQFLYDARIMPKDILTITVNTVNPEAAAPFNLIVRNTLNSTSSSIGTSGGSLQTYLVDNEGGIEFPVLGRIIVGGLTKRECEKLIREDAKGQKQIYHINLNDANLLTSPYYYLQQNDIVYVEPNKVKARNSSIGQSTTLWISATSILISMASLLYNILK